MLTRNRPTFLFLFLALVLFTTTFLVFGERSHLLGFYSDDASWLDVSSFSFNETLKYVSTYVTGRNLHVLWQYLLFGLSSDRLYPDLGVQHWAQAFFTSINVILVFSILRVLGIRILIAFLASTLFAFYPNHGEVQYWMTAIPQNLMSVTWSLLFILVCLYSAFCNKKSSLDPLFFLLAFIFYICALFTYDQVVPIVVIGAILFWGGCYFHKRRPILSLLFLGFSIGAFLFMLVWKMLQPGGGPQFLHLGWEHIWSTMLESFSWSAGRLFINNYDLLLPHIDSYERIIAATAAVSLTFTALVLATQTYKHGHSSDGVSLDSVISVGIKLLGSELRWFSMLFLASIVTYFLAYLPAYLWFIAPRHNYLPSIAICLTFASLASMVLYVLEDHKYFKFSLVFSILLVLICGFLNDRFIRVDLVEKNSWINSYQARMSLYKELEDAGKLNGIRSIILDNFPVGYPYGTAPFGYQANTEVKYFTRGRHKIDNLDKYAFPGSNGFYIYTSLREHGEGAFKFSPYSETLDLKYLGVKGGKIDYKEVDKIENLELPYVLRFDNSKSYLNSSKLKITKLNDAGMYRITLPNTVDIGSDIFTLLPIIYRDKKVEPLTFLNHYQSPTLFLIDVPKPALSNTLLLKFIDVDLKIDGLRLYRTPVSSERSQIIDEASLTK